MFLLFPVRYGSCWTCFFSPNYVINSQDMCHKISVNKNVNATIICLSFQFLSSFFHAVYFQLSIYIVLPNLTDINLNHIGGVMMVSVLASSVVDHGFEPRSDQTKDFKIGICWFWDNHTSLRIRCPCRRHVYLWTVVSVS